MFEVEKVDINLTISAGVAMAITEMMDCFENEIFDCCSSSDRWNLLERIQGMVKANSTYTVWNNGDVFDIHIVD